MKNKKPFLNIDERSKLVAYRVIAVMYFLTIFAMVGVIIYRQFSLGQDISDYEDFAVILTINSIFLITALLYFGAIPLQKIKIKSILLFYALIVIFGTIFTYLKYNVFQSPGLTARELFEKLIIIFAISGIIVIFWLVFSYLGKRKMDRELE